ncbi:hypothetical protein BC835DRAFT_1010971 [Cytidiella melzeri]|nr:hypothetical protein BC835DRAFT_1010971 [Cytidiella melzeri]
MPLSIPQCCMCTSDCQNMSLTTMEKCAQNKSGAGGKKSIQVCSAHTLPPQSIIIGIAICVCRLLCGVTHRSVFLSVLYSNSLIVVLSIHFILGVKHYWHL